MYYNGSEKPKAPPDDVKYPIPEQKFDDKNPLLLGWATHVF